MAACRTARRERRGMTGSPPPQWSSVLAVVAHPDDESFGLGAVLSTFIANGSTVSVLCFTRGEASTLHGVDGDLSTIRAEELGAAARVLRISNVRLKTHPDGALSVISLDDLVRETEEFSDFVGADGIVAFDIGGVTGHPDHQRATMAAIRVAERCDIGVLGWTIPTDVAASLNTEYGTSFIDHDPGDIDLVVDVDRTWQHNALACHPSQAVPGSVLWRRLELLGPREHLRWLRPPANQQAPQTTTGRPPGRNIKGSE